MTAIGDIARIKHYVPDLDVIRARPMVQPDAQDGTPYAVWRAQESAYAHLMRTARLASERPGPPKHYTRQWDLYGGRVTAPAPIEAFLTRNVGPHDGNGTRLWSGHTIHW